MRSYLPVAGRGVVREPADACVSHPRCADTCSSAGSYGCARPASRVCASICELPFAVTVPLVREPTDVCASSRCCRKPVPICRFLLVRGSGLSYLHAHLAFAGHNPAQELPVACVSYRCSGGMSHYLPVPATATIRPCTLTLPSAGDRKSRRARNSPPPEVASPSCRQT